MIVVTRLNGGQFGVNPDLVQRIDSAPDTILTLIDGAKFIVEESMEEVIDRINEHRSLLLARARELTSEPRLELLQGEDDSADADQPLAPAVPLRPRSR
ncbi:flagellar FlbD family protein [Cellulomonas soli]|uniref:flagellar FlbD family protein n=1 Tax=Cellulomonas soli TaxID=931535 RepID=UPI0011BFAD4E|nr:flagellar FlbD family protein [Cellulomonas soli]NYI59545.1 flagellar protein FlbD [Cellulomonas soli]